MTYHWRRIISSLVFFQGSLESPQDIGSLDYLVEWTKLDHSAYCLSLLFTYRDFRGGVLGIAWIAPPELEEPGGICSERVLLAGSSQHMSFNTVMVTFLNFDGRVPRKVSTITIMHEFGHSFGSGVSTPPVAKWFCRVKHSSFFSFNCGLTERYLAIIIIEWGRVGYEEYCRYQEGCYPPRPSASVDNKQLLDEVEHDIMNYQNRGLCYLPKSKAEADNTDTRFW